ncbi:MAG: hypothetical protein ABSC56_13595 [Solirubrobacteraceae bacterium]|jgi:hypothetical protein
MRWRTRLGSAITCALAALCLLPGAVMASSSFKTGLYKGTTSQGAPFEFELQNIACPRKRHLCIYTPSGGTTAQANLDMPCTTTGSSTNAYVDLSQIPVPKSGVIHNSSTAFSLVVVTVKVAHDGTMSGTFEATGTASDNTSDCTSGVVTFTASRT